MLAVYVTVTAGLVFDTVTVPLGFLYSIAGLRRVDAAPKVRVQGHPERRHCRCHVSVCFAEVLYKRAPRQHATRNIFASDPIARLLVCSLWHVTVFCTVYSLVLTKSDGEWRVDHMQRSTGKPASGEEKK